MPTPQFPTVGDESTIEELRDSLIGINRYLNWLMLTLDTKNIFEVGGWRATPDLLADKDKQVGMTTTEEGADPVRFFASPSGDVWLWYVTKSGLMVAQNAVVKGTIEALAGHIGGFTITTDKLYSDSGAGIIQGGTIRTAETGARIELSNNSLITFNDDDQIQGLAWGGIVAGTGINFGDVFLYHTNNKLVQFLDEGTNYAISGTSTATGFALGSIFCPTSARGSWTFSGNVDLGPNTASGTVAYAEYAEAAASSSSADSVDWSNVTNHPNPTTTPLMDGSASIGSSGRYAYSDHRHPTDTTRAPLASPTFSGTPTAPTPATTDSSTTLATTAFVNPGNSLGSSGYQKLAGGLILQWGQTSDASVAAGGTVNQTFTFPLPFPNGVYQATATLDVTGAGANGSYCNEYAITSTNMGVVLVNTTAATQTYRARIFAIGH